MKKIFIGCGIGLLMLMGPRAKGQEAKLPKIPAELKIELIAAPPEVEAVTAVAAAPDGSLYIGCDPMDMRLNSDKPQDYIVLIRGTGANRKLTRFADKIGPIMGIQYFRGALYILHDPYLSVLRDTDGDGVADQREDLVTNLGPKLHPGLNDHIVTGFTLGMDGFFYISVGDKGSFNTKAKDGSTATLHGGGTLRVRPDGTDLEVFSTGTRNHLEVDLDAEDHVFTSDNTDDGQGWWTRVTHHIEGGYYGYPYDYKGTQNNSVTVPSTETKNVSKPDAPVNEAFLPAMADYGGGSPTGGIVYLSDGFPESYRGDALFSEWGKGRVFGVKLERVGATFKVSKDYPLIEPGKGGELRPMMQAIGPDGSLYVADWNYGGWKANPVVGRVWRLYWPDANPAPRIADTAPLKDQIAALAHPDRNQRLRAQWNIITQGEPAIKLLAAILSDKNSPALQKWHATWALEGIGSAAPNLRTNISNILLQTLKDPDGSVRTQALRAIGMRKQVAQGLLADKLMPFLKDADPEVRLQCATALGRICNKTKQSELVAQASLPVKQIVTFLLAALNDDDRWVRFAVRTALQRIVDWNAIAPALADKNDRIREQAWLTFSGVYDENAVKFLADMAKANRDPVIGGRALELLARVAQKERTWDGSWWGTQPAGGKPPAKTIAWEGTSLAAQSFVAALDSADAAVRVAAVKGLASTQLRDPLVALRARLAKESDAAVRRELVSALGVLKDTEALPTLVKFLDEKDDVLRLATVIALESIGNDAAKTSLTALVARDDLSAATLARACEAAGTLKISPAAPTLATRLRHSDATVRVAAAKALAKTAPTNLADTLIAVLSDATPDVQRETIKALGAMKSKAAVPALVERAKDEALRMEATLALAQMPDARAVRIYAKGLGDKNRDIREACGKALRALFSDAHPTLAGPILGFPGSASFNQWLDAHPDLWANTSRNLADTTQRMSWINDSQIATYKVWRDTHTTISLTTLLNGGYDNFP